MSDTKDSNGNILNDGDSVQLIKDLKVKGTSVTLKRGSVAKNIRLTDDPEEVECSVEKVKGLVLKVPVSEPTSAQSCNCAADRGESSSIGSC